MMEKLDISNVHRVATERVCGKQAGHRHYDHLRRSGYVKNHLSNLQIVFVFHLQVNVNRLGDKLDSREIEREKNYSDYDLFHQTKHHHQTTSKTRSLTRLCPNALSESNLPIKSTRF